MNPVLNAAFAAVVVSGLSSSAGASVLAGDDFSKSARHARCISSVVVSNLSGGGDSQEFDPEAKQVLAYHFLKGVEVMGAGFSNLAKSFVHDYSRRLNDLARANKLATEDLNALKADVLLCVGEVRSNGPSALVSYDR
ncbi:MAG TPA: hypothetical protein PKI93_07080 [Alphaproteobacteria bacterium]|nr:hypothetical protein [Alphaproteobacteria bacterium]